MWPILFSAGPIIIRTLNLIMVFAFLSAAFLFWRKSREEHYDEKVLFDGFLATSIVGLVAARVGFVITHVYEFGRSFWLWFDIISRPGMDLFFGVLVATIYLYRFAKNKRLDAYEILDFWSLSLSFGLAMFWLGLFFNGTAFGYPTHWPWGMVFPTVFEKHHPTQLYLFILTMLLFLFLGKMEYKYRTFNWYRAKRKSAQSGFLISIFTLGSGIILAIVSTIKPATYIIGNWQLDLFIWLGLALCGGVMLFIRSGRTLPKIGR